MHSGGINFNSTFDLAKNLQLDANLAYNKIVAPSYPRYGYGPKNHMYTIVVWMGDDVNGKNSKNTNTFPGRKGIGRQVTIMHGIIILTLQPKSSSNPKVGMW